MLEREVEVLPDGLRGTLRAPAHSKGIVVFAHGSGSSRTSPRNRAVAERLNREGLATLLFDLLRPAEEADRKNVFDIHFLAQRLVEAIRWVDCQPALSRLPLGLFGASTGAAAALKVAALLGDRVVCVVSRGGRPDLAGKSLRNVRAPTLLIVGGADHGVIEFNKAALGELPGEKALEVVPEATHLFAEPGALEAVVALATRWFSRHLFGQIGQES